MTVLFNIKSGLGRADVFGTKLKCNLLSTRVFYQYIYPAACNDVFITHSYDVGVVTTAIAGIAPFWLAVAEFIR